MKDEREIRLTAFIESVKTVEPAYLEELLNKALGEGVPVIRPQTRGLIRFLLETVRPLQILEVGTGVGYSALFMREYAPAAAILTIEADPARAEEARQNFAKAGAQNITLAEDDAAKVLPELSGPYDFVFMDGPKAQYLHYLPEVKRLMAEGAVLLSDNILQEGEILESRYAVTRRNRTIHARMRSYLEALTEDPGLTTVILGTGDGAAITLKRRKTGHE